MQLSEKWKTFCQLYFAFLKSTLSFEDFQQKDEPHRLSISKIVDSERLGYLIVENIPFQNSLWQSTC